MLITRRPRAGTGQQIAIHQRLRPATCDEVDCELKRNGRRFWVEHLGRFITHPAGADCGPRCPNDICPCVNNGPWPGAGGYPHRVAADLPLGYRADGQVAGESEALDRLGEGIEAIRLVRTRGL